MGFEFQWPWAFALLILPLLWRLLSPKPQQQAALYMPLATEQGSNIAPSQNKTPWLISSCLWLMWALLVCSAARPIYIGDAVELPKTGRDIMLAVDISGSMQEDDMQLNGQTVDRLTLVKSVLADFISQREGDRLGLILFADQAYIQAPLTFDLTTLKTLLDESQIGFAGRKTAIGDAIGLAVKRLSDKDKQSEQEQNVLILLTDGQNTAGAVEPIKASQIAAQEDIKIYTIGIGSDQARARPGMFNFGS